MDAKNTLTQHIIVFVFAAAVILSFRFLEGIEWSTAFGRASFILLFLTLIIGPLMKIKKPSSASTPLATPWSWRGELGIWFAVTALAHFIVIAANRPFSGLIKIGGSGFSLANLLGLIALFWTLLLAATSFRKVILFLGVDSWKWLHTSTYVIFYLVFAHLIYFQFFSTHGKIGPDWFGYFALACAALVIAAQLIAFATVIMRNRKPTKSV